MNRLRIKINLIEWELIPTKTIIDRRNIEYKFLFLIVVIKK